MANIKRANTSGITKSGSAISDVPDAPTIGAATNVGTSCAYNNGSATVAFTAAATGGTPASYTATSTPGSFTASGAGSPLTITGLQSATSYTFAVTATNTTATGPASSASSSITATTIPAAPTIGTATATAYNTVSVAFTAGATGGAAVSTYTVTSSSGASNTGSSSPIVVTETTAGSRTYTVTATNANGTSAASAASNSATTQFIPSAPTIGTATDSGSGRAYNNGSASITFTNTAGGAPTTSFTVTSSPGSFTASGASSPLTVTGLASGTAYTFTVTATNGSGTSSASSASNSITATTIPAAPTIGTATATGSTTATVAYTANATGGAAVSTYTATSSPGGLTGTGASPITVSGLTAGTAYTFTVTATNANGTSTASSASNSTTTTYPATALTVTGTGQGYGKAVGGIDTSGNIYVGGENIRTGNSGLRAFFYKQNGSGTVTVSREIYTNNAYNQNQGAEYGALDSSFNYYQFGYGTNDVSSTYYGITTKWDSSGTLQWSKSFVLGNGSVMYNSGGGADSSGNVYSIGWANNSGTPAQSTYVIKHNSSGTVQWVYITPTTSAVCYSGSVDSSGNIIGVGNMTNGSYPGAYLMKMNNAGTIQWQTAYSVTRASYFQGSTTDSSGNVYAVGTSAGSTSPYYSRVVLFKFNSSGTIQWQRRLYNASANVGGSIQVVSTNSNGDVFVGCQDNNLQYAYFAKYNSSGTIQWQRQVSVSGSSGSTRFDSISCSNDFVLVGVRLSGSPVTPAYLKLPVDGSKTGTYTLASRSVIYEASSLSEAAGDLSAVGISATWSSTSSYTAGTYSATEQASGFTAETAVL